MKRLCISSAVAGMVILILSSCVARASALDYQQDLGVNFTFSPTLKVTLSSADLIIPNLAPGTASDSNVITVRVLTNNTAGYTLNASVGNDSLYNTRDLLHTNPVVTSKFASVDYGASLASLSNLTENTWSYAYLDTTLNNGTNTTWTAYSGLPLYSDTTNVANLKTSTTPVTTATGDDIKFKIAAKASATQTSGEYNNVINFTAVASPVPTTLYMAFENAGKEKYMGYYKMQDMTAELCASADVIDEGSQLRVIDTRDNKTYWITKLRDGKCWMTQNLDHDIDINFAYTPQNTDIPSNWKPDKSTFAFNDETWDSSVGGYYVQQSRDPGNKIWNGVLDTDETTDWSNMAQGTDLHYHLGNYYNFGAAVAMNRTDSYLTQGQDLNQSICPKGWTLPKSGNNTSAGSFKYLLDQYDISSGSTTKIWDAPLYFTLGGQYPSAGLSSFISSRAYYVSPIIQSSDAEYVLYGSYYQQFRVYPAGSWQRYAGFSVRCVSR